MQLFVVSIPHWYNYKTFRDVRSKGGILVSIPHWYNYKQEFAVKIKQEANKFQFHIGTIISRAEYKSIVSEEVSIPHWYNYKQEQPEL